MPYDVSETAATPGTPDTLFVPYFAPDESDRDGNAVNDYLSDYTGLAGLLVFDNRTRQGQVAKYGTPTRSRRRTATGDRTATSTAPMPAANSSRSRR